MIAKAMGHRVTVISSSDKKKEEALKHLRADDFSLAEMKRAANNSDYILDTVPAFHPLESHLWLLKPEGKLLIVGAVPQRLQFFASELITGMYRQPRIQEVERWWRDRKIFRAKFVIF